MFQMFRVASGFLIGSTVFKCLCRFRFSSELLCFPNVFVFPVCPIRWDFTIVLIFSVVPDLSVFVCFLDSFHLLGISDASS